MRQPGDRAPAPEALNLAQDLANTIDIESDRDWLQTVERLSRFAARHGLDGLTFTEADLRRSRAFREALRVACLAHAGHSDANATSRVLNLELRRAPLELRVGPEGGARVNASSGLTGASALFAEIAAGISRSIHDGSWLRLKACSNDTCRWVYYDHSTTGNSRWCTMKVCGSRAKMRRYRASRTGQRRAGP